jgi:hypothetical protein
MARLRVSPIVQRTIERGKRPRTLEPPAGLDRTEGAGLRTEAVLVERPLDCGIPLAPGGGQGGPCTGSLDAAGAAGAVCFASPVCAAASAGATVATTSPSNVVRSGRITSR